MKRSILALVAAVLATSCAAGAGLSVQPVTRSDALRARSVGPRLIPHRHAPKIVVPSPAPGGLSGVVATVVQTGRARNVVLVDAATGRQLTPRPKLEWNGPALPRASRDGRYVVYIGRTLFGRRLTLWDAEAGREIPLPGLKNIDARDPDLSADGQRLVFVQKSIHGDALCVYDVAAGTLRRLRLPKDMLISPHDPAISGDGRKLAYAGGCSRGDQQIYLVDLETERPISPPTLNTVDDEIDPALSADGQVLLFSSDRNGSLDLFGYRLQEGSYVNMSAYNSLDDERAPRFVGPTDSGLAFLSDVTGKLVLYLQPWR